MADVTEVPANKKSATRELVETVVLALLIAIVVRWMVVEVYQVKGHSMENTLHNGERVLVNKFIYKAIRQPQAGDIIVFQSPRHDQRDFIKRVVAVAGQKVEMRKGIVYVDGVLVPDAATVLATNHDYAPFTVSPNHVWVLGDNRNNSDDSRFFGEVHVDEIRGMAFLRIWPVGQVTLFRNPVQAAAN